MGTVAATIRTEISTNSRTGVGSEIGVACRPEADWPPAILAPLFLSPVNPNPPLLPRIALPSKDHDTSFFQVRGPASRIFSIARRTRGGPKTMSTLRGFCISMETGACHQKLSKNITLKEKDSAAIYMYLHGLSATSPNARVRYQLSLI